MPLAPQLAEIAWLAANGPWIRIVEPEWWTPSEADMTASWYGKDVLVRYSNTA